jgi:ATP-dependent helicase HrpB
VLSSGTGARLGRESGVVNAEFLVAVDVTAGVAGPAHEALVRLATGIERDWLSPTSVILEHEFDPTSGAVRASQVERYDQLILRRIPCAADPLVASALIAEAYIRRGPTSADRQLIQRLKFAGVPLSFESLVHSAGPAQRLDDLDLGAQVPPPARRTLARDAPATITAPTGRAIRLDYRDDGVFAAVKLQEVFGLAETPRLGPNQVPVTFELLAPNGRPVQVTKDLKSFWTRGYLEVRKELRARYPKHQWPEDPGRT